MFLGELGEQAKARGERFTITRAHHAAFAALPAQERARLERIARQRTAERTLAEADVAARTADASQARLVSPQRLAGLVLSKGQRRRVLQTSVKSAAQGFETDPCWSQGLQLATREFALSVPPINATSSNANIDSRYARHCSGKPVVASGSTPSPVPHQHLTPPTISRVPVLVSLRPPTNINSHSE